MMTWKPLKLVSAPLRWTFLFLGLTALIIIPFIVYGQEFEEYSGLLFSKKLHSAAIVATIIALLTADIFLPIPSSIVGVFSGYSLGLCGGAAANWCGLMLGSTLAYAFGAGFKSTLGNRLFSAHELSQAKFLASKIGDSGLVLVRAVPVLAELSTIGAGFTGFPARRYFVLMALSNLGLATAYAYIGSLTRESGGFAIFFGASIILPSFVWVMYKVTGFKARQHRQRQDLP